MTHTFAFLEVLPPTYADIRKRLEDRGYDHAFIQGPSPEPAILMDGLALIKMITPRVAGPTIYSSKYTSADDPGFKEEALRHVLLWGHAKADEIFEFAKTIGERGNPMFTVWALEQIASFMQ